MFPCVHEITMQNLWHVKTKKESEIRNYITYMYALPVERNWESKVVNIISNDFSRSSFAKCKPNHASLVNWLQLNSFEQINITKPDVGCP